MAGNNPLVRKIANILKLKKLIVNFLLLIFFVWVKENESEVKLHK